MALLSTLLQKCWGFDFSCLRVLGSAWEWRDPYSGFLTEGEYLLDAGWLKSIPCCKVTCQKRVALLRIDSIDPALNSRMFLGLGCSGAALIIIQETFLNHMQICFLNKQNPDVFMLNQVFFRSTRWSVSAIDRHQTSKKNCQLRPCQKISNWKYIARTKWKLCMKFQQHKTWKISSGLASYS